MLQLPVIGAVGCNNDTVASSVSIGGRGTEATCLLCCAALVNQTDKLCYYYKLLVMQKYACFLVCSSGKCHTAL